MTIKTKRAVKLALLTVKISIFTLFSLSCVTAFSFKEINDAVGQNDYLTAVEAMEKSQGSYRNFYDKKNEVSFFLDKGFLKYYAGDYEASCDDLHNAEKLMERTYFKKSMEDFFSYIQNDYEREYPGEDFEDIYLNIFNALNYYNAGNTENALAEIQKIIAPEGKLDRLSKKYDYKDPKTNLSMVDFSRKQTGVSNMPSIRSVSFSNSALARYLGSLLYRSEGNMSAAQNEIDQVNKAFAVHKNIYQNPIPQTIQMAHNIPAEKARLDIIGFTGLSPIKEETESLQILPFMHPVLQVARLKVPGLVRRPSYITGIEVIIDGKDKFNLELLEDMGAVIEDIFSARYSNMLMRIYIQTIIKYAAADIAAMAASGSDNEMAGLAIALAAQSQMAFVDRADIRMSRFLPDKAYIGGIDLSPGAHSVLINYYSGSSIVAAEERETDVKIGKLNLLQTVNLK